MAMTVDELWGLMERLLDDFKSENSRSHECILDKIERIRAVEQVQDLAIQAVRLQAENAKNNLATHMERHWALFVALIVVFLGTLVSVALHFIPVK